MPAGRFLNRPFDVHLSAMGWSEKHFNTGIDHKGPKPPLRVPRDREGGPASVTPRSFAPFAPACAAAGDKPQASSKPAGSRGCSKHSASLPPAISYTWAVWYSRGMPSRANRWRASTTACRSLASTSSTSSRKVPPGEAHNLTGQLLQALPARIGARNAALAGHVELEILRTRPPIALEVATAESRVSVSNAGLKRVRHLVGRSRAFAIRQNHRVCQRGFSKRGRTSP